MTGFYMRQAHFRPALVTFAALSVLLSLCFSACGPETPPVVPKAPPEMSQADLQTAFESATTVLLDAKTSPALAKITPRWQATVMTTERGLKVTAAGADPQLVLPPFVAGRQVVGQIVIESPANTPLELFCMFRGQDKYAPTHYVRYSVKKGRNVIFFHLDGSDMIDPVRLDPGIAAGEYLIESITVKERATKP